MSPVRRSTPAPAPPPAVEDTFTFGNLSAYAGGKTIPEGDYALEYTVMNRPPSTTGKSFPDVGVMVSAHPLAGGDPFEQFLSFGGKTHLSWTPDAETGKKLVKIPGGPGLPPSNKSNWFIHLDSLAQCNGGPLDFLANDMSVLDGVWAHIKPMPEPEERKSYKRAPATGETGTGEDEPRSGGLIPCITEILDGGKPWEGGGGFTTAAPAPAPVARGKVAVAPKAVTKPVAVPAPVEADTDDEELVDVATNALGEVLSMPEYASSIKRLKLRISVHSVVQKKYGDQTATDVTNTYLSDDAALAAILGPIGYKIKGAGPQADIVPA